MSNQLSQLNQPRWLALSQLMTDLVALTREGQYQPSQIVQLYLNQLN